MAYKVYDVSMAIHADMTVYKNKPEKKPSIRVVQDFDKAAARESRVDLDMHTGTHVDSPLHMVPNGGTMETLPLEKLVGPCRVLDLTHVEGGISRADLEAQNIQKDEFLAEDGAKYLAEVGIRGVAIDALGIERSQTGHPTHKTLFGAGVVIIEGLRLAEVPAGNYFLVGAPIKLLETEAAPARVLLFEGLTY